MSIAKFSYDTLHGSLFDAAVAKACNLPFTIRIIEDYGSTCYVPTVDNAFCKERAFSPTKDWTIAGSIIETYGINLKMLANGHWASDSVHGMLIIDSSAILCAMRTFVCMVFGTEVEL